MPKFVYIDDMDELLPTTETIHRFGIEAGLKPQHNIRQAVNYSTGLSEDSMAFHFLMSQDPWDDDWGN